MTTTNYNVPHTPPTEADLDQLTRALTAFNTFRELLETSDNYRPTIYQTTPDHVKLSDAYDLAQIGRGDPRRTYRGKRDQRPVPVTLTMDEARQLMDFLNYHEDVLVDGGWDHVESAQEKLADALKAVG